MAITINIYYTGKNGSTEAFAAETTQRGVVDQTRAETGNIRYEYFIPMDKPETILLIDRWIDQAAIDEHHKSPMMQEIIRLSGVKSKFVCKFPLGIHASQADRRAVCSSAM